MECSEILLTLAGVSRGANTDLVKTARKRQRATFATGGRSLTLKILALFFY